MGGRKGPSGQCFDQKADVLARSDHPILDLLPPQAAPSGAFEAVAVGGLGEATLGEVLAPCAVPTCGDTEPLLLGTLNQGLVAMSLEGATVDSPRT